MQRLSRSYGLVLCLALFPLIGMANPTVQYQRDVKPVLEQKCIACHGCYDAPCQLKLEDSSGLQRGASKTPVYKGTRTEAAAPSRLHQDETTTEGWRQRGFFSVTEGAENSVLQQMLSLGRQTPYGANRKLPDDMVLGLARQNRCPNPAQFEDYADNHPNGGMPLGTTGLSDQEFQTLSQWLKQGAPISPAPLSLSADEKAQIKQWETLLNSNDKRHRLVGRWLYEHLFLAHLYFADGSDERPSHFFRLVRSRTAPGEAVEPVTTVRPNDPPPAEFWYRLQPIRGSIVHKTHITFALGPKKLARTRELFFQDQWPVESLPGYGPDYQANPFITFAAIPARARYQFMLDNADYFIRTFIRGPVCRGQVATDVIRDHFWTVFQDPDQDRYINDADYRSKVSGLLSLPGTKDNLLALGPEWLAYRKKRNDYLAERKQAYAQNTPQGPGWNSIWDGDGDNPSALLTIFRHHDNASVRQGLIGDLPLTTWVMDYPLLERSYYSLVANFNVFGSVSHQAQTRLYFDLIRNGAEQNTLRYLPENLRQIVLDNWYQNTGKLRLFLSYASVDRQTPTAIDYKTRTPMNEFNNSLLTRFADINARQDPINRCSDNACQRQQETGWVRKSDQILSRLASQRAAQLPALQRLPEVTLLRVENKDGQRHVYSLLRNRAHSNVAFMMGESLRYQPALDTLTVYPGILSSYPNFMFNVPAKELKHFVTRLRAIEDDSDFTHVIEQFGIRRTHPDFWYYFQDMTRYLHQHQPIEAGMLDLNRYKNL